MALEDNLDIIDRNRNDFWAVTYLFAGDLTRTERVGLAFIEQKIRDGSYRSVEDFKDQYEIFVDRLKEGRYQTDRRRYSKVILNEH